MDIEFHTSKTHLTHMEKTVLATNLHTFICRKSDELGPLANRSCSGMDVRLPQALKPMNKIQVERK